MPTALAKPRAEPVGQLIRQWRQRRRWSQLALADPLDVPLRERNLRLVSAGFAPTFRERALDDPELALARAAIERVLHAQAPNPALAVGRHWNLVTANAPAQHVLHRLRRQVEASGDPLLAALLAELEALPLPPGAAAAHMPSPGLPLSGVVVPLQLRTPLGTLSFLSTTMVFGTAVDITLSELVLESLFPADAATAQALARLAADASP